MTDIKTINDACLKVGVDYESFVAMIGPLPEHMQALAAMEIIIKALNDGWVHPLDGLTRVWFPWVYIYEAHEQERMEKVYPDREDLIRFTRPDGSCGLASADSFNAWSVSCEFRLSPCHEIRIRLPVLHPEFQGPSGPIHPADGGLQYP